MEYLIVPATPDDVVDIQAIYTYYVDHTTISFDYIAPSKEEMLVEMQQIFACNLPYLVAKNSQTEHVLGFAYATPFSKKQAYAYTCNLTIYVKPELKARGIGQRLYLALEQALIELGMVQLLAIITSDNNRSLQFHLRNGFAQIGTFSNAGYKFDKWHSIHWLAKTIACLN